MSSIVLSIAKDIRETEDRDFILKESIIRPERRKVFNKIETQSLTFLVPDTVLRTLLRLFHLILRSPVT